MNRYEIAILKLFESIQCLHNRGYELLRFMSYFSPSGCYFRVVISLRKYFDIHSGFDLRYHGDEFDDKKEVYRYSTGGLFEYFYGEGSMENATPEELADKILEKYPELERQGKGEDPNYKAWFRDVVMPNARKALFPYAFCDWGYDMHEEGQILLTDDETYIEFAPSGEIDSGHKMWIDEL